MMRYHFDQFELITKQFSLRAGDRREGGQTVVISKGAGRPDFTLELLADGEYSRLGVW